MPVSWKRKAKVVAVMAIIVFVGLCLTDKSGNGNVMWGINAGATVVGAVVAFFLL